MTSEIETIEIAENGNTNSFSASKKTQINQLINWFFTYNNYKKGDIEIIETKFKDICKKYVFQEEIGEKNGVPHLQGSIELKKKMRWTEFGLMKQIHWQKTRNEDAADKYCEKAYTRNGEIFKGGKFKKKKKTLRTISVLRPWQEDIEKIILSQPDTRTIHWYHEPVGGIGKTAFIKYMVEKYNDKIVVATSGSQKDLACLLAERCEKDEDFDINDDITVLIDYDREKEGFVSYSGIKRLKDGLITSAKYHTGTLVFNNPNVIIMANFPPEEDKISKDQWKITYLG